MAKLIFGFTVEGVERGGKQVMFTTDTSQKAQPMFDALDVQPVEGLLDRLGSVDTSIEPFKNQERYANYQFRLSATQEVGSILFNRASGTVAKTTVRMNDTGDDLLTDTTGLVGKTVFIDAETMKITQANGPPAGKYKVERGYAGTQARPHNKGVNVYDRVPYWLGRKSLFYSYEVGADEPILREILSIQSSFVQDNAEIIIKLDSPLAGLKNAKVNLDPPPAEKRPTFEFSDNNEPHGFVNIDSSIYKKGDNHPYKWVQAGGQVQLMLRNTFRRPKQRLKPRSRVDEDRFNDPIHELFVIAREFDILTVPLSSTIMYKGYKGDNTYMYHPLAIAASFLLSKPTRTKDLNNFDAFGANWTLNLGSFFNDEAVQNIHRLIERTKYLKVDQLVLGWDGREVEIIKVIRRLLNTYGFRLASDTKGYLKFSKIEILNLETYSKAIQNQLEVIPSGVLNLNEGASEAVNVIEGTYGKTPWFDGSSFVINARDPNGNIPPLSSGNNSSTSIDVEGIAPGSLGTLRTLMEAQSLLQSERMARLQVKVEDWVEDDLDLSLGAFVTLGDLPLVDVWLFNSKGERVRISAEGMNKWAGQIIGRRYVPKENKYEIEMIFSSDNLALWRAPSGVIGFVSGNLVVMQPADLDPDGDSRHFTKGDEVMFKDLNGVNVDPNIYEITDTDQNSIYVDGTPSASSGDVIELAHLKTTGPEGYENIGLDGQFKAIDLVYAYLSDQNNELGSGDKEGSIIGG